MQFMLLIYNDPAAGPAEGSPESFAEFGQWMAYTQEMRAAGVLLSGDPLEGTPSATTVRQRDGETLLVDGPFAETKEHLGGYYILELPDLEAAVDWAAKAPSIHYGSVEIRPVMAIPAEA